MKGVLMRKPVIFKDYIVSQYLATVDYITTGGVHYENNNLFEYAVTSRDKESGKAMHCTPVKGAYNKSGAILSKAHDAWAMSPNHPFVERRLRQPYSNEFLKHVG